MSLLQKMINTYTLLITKNKPIQKSSTNYFHLMTHSFEVSLFYILKDFFSSTFAKHDQTAEAAPLSMEFFPLRLAIVDVRTIYRYHAKNASPVEWCLNEKVELLCKLAMPRLSSGV